MPGGPQTGFLLAGDKDVQPGQGCPRGHARAGHSLPSGTARPGRFLGSLAALLCPVESSLLLPWPSAEAVLSFRTHLHPLQSGCPSSQTPLNLALNCSSGVANMYSKIFLAGVHVVNFLPCCF